MSGRSRYEALIRRCCFKEVGHSGPCSEYPYLHHLEEVAPRVAAKIKRDATKTTGAAWKSEDAGPNRIDRWVMLLPDDNLRDMFGIDITAMRPTVQAKLRDKAATYEECMAVAAKLTWLAYQMQNAPAAPHPVQAYLEGRFGAFKPGSTRCIVCRDHLNFEAFEQAQRGRALIETAHSNPRLHNPDNVGFAHRECNIAQGGLSLNEFYDWTRAIIERVDAEESPGIEASGSYNSTSFPND